MLKTCNRLKANTKKGVKIQQPMKTNQNPLAKSNPSGRSRTESGASRKFGSHFTWRRRWRRKRCSTRRRWFARSIFKPSSSRCTTKSNSSKQTLSKMSRSNCCSEKDTSQKPLTTKLPSIGVGFLFQVPFSLFGFVLFRAISEKRTRFWFALLTETKPQIWNPACWIISSSMRGNVRKCQSAEAQLRLCL